MRPIAHDVAYLQSLMVNLYFVGIPGAGPRGWTLVDAGMPGYAHSVMRSAAARFGRDARPNAIILTHAHFDHVGSLHALLDHWDVPVYAHELELPYLTGQASYPPADPSVGGGAMAWTSRMLPRGPIDITGRVRPLPSDGSVPGMPDWHWIHTPGHSPGHVSLFRDADRFLIAGDAFVTTKQESLIGALTQFQTMHGPPWYFTQDWVAARASVQKLAALEPEVAATGHGLPMHGQELRAKLHALAENFWDYGAPRDGRYVRQPAIFGPNGPTYVPPPTGKPPTDLLITLALAAGFGALALAAFTGRPDRQTLRAPVQRVAGVLRRDHREVDAHVRLERSQPSAGPH